MTKEQAILEAKKIAREDGIRMIVTFNPYAEYKTDEWSYLPAAAKSIFSHDEEKFRFEPGEIT
jgi:hypothetical protein